MYQKRTKNVPNNVPLSRFYAYSIGENKGLRWRDIPLLWAERDPSRCTQGLGRVGPGPGYTPHHLLVVLHSRAKGFHHG